MRNVTRQTNYEVFSNLNGGLATRPTPLLIEAGSKKAMLSPALRNVDFFAKGGVDKRKGKEKQGNSLGTPALYVTLASPDDSTNSTTFSSIGDGAFAQKFVSGASAVITEATFKVSAVNGVASTVYGYVAIFTDSGNLPGTILGYSAVKALANSATPAENTFSFNSPVSLSATTAYWIAIIAIGTLGGGNILYVRSKAAGGGSSDNFQKTTDITRESPTWSSGGSYILYGLIYEASTNGTIQGIYDFRFGASSTQKQMTAIGGALYWNNAGTWTSLVTGLGSGQNALWSYSALDDYLYTLDYGNNIGRTWDGIVSYTVQMGFRATFSAARSTAAGTVAAGTYKVLGVTTMKNGGYRSTASATIDMTGGGTQQIAVTNVVIADTSASNFGFTVDATATLWFCTVANGSIYYKIDNSDISVAQPMANSTTSFNITDDPAGTENTLLDEYGLPQEYFTNQIATPTCKFSTVFQNFFVLAGDGTYPRRVWFSELGAGAIWAQPAVDTTASPIYGTYLDIGDADDNEPLVGVFAWGEYLYALKRHSIYIISYTGNASAPFQTSNISKGLGCLSHFSCKALGSSKFVFISERGPAECFGTSVRIIPEASNILDRFDPNNTTRYSLSAMQYTTAGHNATKMQVWWGVSSTSATTRDLTLVYDYENGAFWENDVSANVYAEVTDTNFFPAVWSGDYSAQVFKMDTGTSDNGSAIDFYFDSPWYQGKAPNVWKQWDEFYIQGTTQSSGTLSVDVYLDFGSSSSYTRTFDMTLAEFKTGASVPLGDRAKAIKVRVRNSELSVPVHIDSIGFGYQDLGFSV